MANIPPTPIDLVLGDTMATYITLLNFTEQGVNTVKELAVRISAGRQALKLGWKNSPILSDPGRTGCRGHF